MEYNRIAKAIQKLSNDSSIVVIKALIAEYKHARDFEPRTIQEVIKYEAVENKMRTLIKHAFKKRH